MTNSEIIKKYIKTNPFLKDLGTRYIVSKTEKKYGEKFSEELLIKSLKEELFVTTAEEMLIYFLTKEIKKELEKYGEKILNEKIQENFSDTDKSLKIDINRVKKTILKKIDISIKEETKQVSIINNKNGKGSESYKISLPKSFVNRMTKDTSEKINVTITKENKIIIEK